MRRCIFGAPPTTSEPWAFSLARAVLVDALLVGVLAVQRLPHLGLEVVVAPCESVMVPPASGRCDVHPRIRGDPRSAHCARMSRSTTVVGGRHVAERWACSVAFEEVRHDVCSSRRCNVIGRRSPSRASSVPGPTWCRRHARAAPTDRQQRRRPGSRAAAPTRSTPPPARRRRVAETCGPMRSPRREAESATSHDTECASSHRPRRSGSRCPRCGRDRRRPRHLATWRRCCLQEVDQRPRRGPAGSTVLRGTHDRLGRSSAFGANVRRRRPAVTAPRSSRRLARSESYRQPRRCPPHRRDRAARPCATPSLDVDGPGCSATAPPREHRSADARRAADDRRSRRSSRRPAPNGARRRPATPSSGSTVPLAGRARPSATDTWPIVGDGAGVRSSATSPSSEPVDTRGGDAGAPCPSSSSRAAVPPWARVLRDGKPNWAQKAVRKAKPGPQA